MADKKVVGHAYNVDFLNVVFAASSVFLFVAVMWMVWDDYDREWKNYQRRFVQLETEVTQVRYKAAEDAIDREQLEQLTNKRVLAEAELAENREKVEELEEQLESVEVTLFRVNQDHQFTKANLDAERYEFEVQREENPEEARELGNSVSELFNVWEELGLEVEKLTAERDGLREQIGTFTGEVEDVDRQIRDLTAENTRLEERLEALLPSVINDYVLNAPLLDFMAPTLTIRQVITPQIVDDINFIRVPKMDRCTTCHLSIDREGYEGYPQPYKTHPNLSVYVGSASPHPLEGIGCTVCHEGMGQSVTFQDSTHTPVDEEQLIRWKEEHGWEEPHLWDYPMLPRDMTEASCAKCHKEEIYVPEADVLGVAYGTYERAGCYACHKTEGFEGLRKPGPNLTRVKAKLTPEWVARWIRNPRAVKATTWMPKVWYNSNTSAPDDAARNEIEIDSVVAYLFENSDGHEFAVNRPPVGNQERGLQVIESVGCLACHVMGDETRTEVGPRRTFGQPLENIGNKTTFEWLFDWVRDPSHYSPDTYMPDLRLTDQEAADIAEYLVSLKGAAGEEAKATYDDSSLDEVLLDYLKSVVPTEEAIAIVDGMTADERRLELGERAIGRYGCYSCHDINGFENAQPIGIELSEEGSKLLQRLDFTFEHIPHTKIEWFLHKLKDPRVYDRNRELQPLERLRMPDYGLSEHEAKILTTAIMSFQSDVQPRGSWVPRSARVDALVTGRNLVRRRNCVACHTIEGDGGDYQELVADASLAPPLLTPEGAKVKPDWLYDFLKGPIAIRPWLSVRMPSFDMNDGHWNDVIGYFGAISNTVGPFRDETIHQSVTTSRAGRELFDRLRCQQCHVLDTIPEDQPTDNLAPDLRMARDRLQPNWILDWLRAPLEIQPGTRMPMFWTEYPESVSAFDLENYPSLNGDAVAQIEVIRDYLLTFSGGPSPSRSN